MESRSHYFEEFSKEEIIAWIQNKLEKDLVRSSSNSSAISMIRVEPCFIFYAYELGSLSGITSEVLEHIPTDDIRINKDGSILYTLQGVRSNCPSAEDTGEMIIRMTAADINVKGLGIGDDHQLTLAIQHLNSFCNKK